jgi:hypothetical protein
MSMRGLYPYGRARHETLCQACGRQQIAATPMQVQEGEVAWEEEGGGGGADWRG